MMQHPQGNAELEKWLKLARNAGVWSELEKEFLEPYMQQTLKVMIARRAQLKAINMSVFPLGPDVFRAYKETPLDKVKVVMLGQDPYHTPDTADGLAFSSRKKMNQYMDMRTSIPSMWHICESLDDMWPDNFPPMIENDLTSWANQGVLLLNRVLTVDQGKAKSHYNPPFQWQRFTKKTIELVDKKDHIVWILLGKPAQEAEKYLKNTNRLVIMQEHPAAAAYRNGKWDHGKCFLRANEYLVKHGKEPIEWIINMFNETNSV